MKLNELCGPWRDEKEEYSLELMKIDLEYYEGVELEVTDNEFMKLEIKTLIIKVGYYK